MRNKMLLRFFRKSFIGFLIFSFLIYPVAPVFAKEHSASENTTVSASISTQTTASDISINSKSIDHTNNSQKSENTKPEKIKDVKLDHNKPENKPDFKPDAKPVLSADQKPKTDSPDSAGASDLPSQAPPKTNNHSEVDQTTGALTYTYPIELPKGVNNFSPFFSLKYNSQDSKNGSIYGYGWSDSIPYIERENKHGTNEIYTSDDFLSSVDGELASVDSTHFAPMVENGSFHNYSFTDNTFTLIDKNGTTYKYGETADSRQEDFSNPDHVYKWMLSSMTDTNGNVISYEYFKDAGAIYPSAIKYAGIYETTFGKETNPRPEKIIIPESTVNYRISNISVKALGSLARSYDILLTSNSAYSVKNLIGSINETGYDESNNPTTVLPTVFSWQESGGGFVKDSSFTMPIHHLSDGDQYSVLNVTRSYYNTGIKRSNKMIDVNGDGVLDWVETNYDAGPNEFYGVWLGTSTGWVKSDLWTQNMPFNIDNSGNITTLVLDYSDYRYVSLTDVNGDSLPDFVETSKVIENKGYNGVWLNTGSGWALDPDWSLPTFEIAGNTKGVVIKGLNEYMLYSYEADFYDVNNDGLTDIVQTTSDSLGSSGTSNYYGVYINNGHGWFKDSSWIIPIHYLSSTGLYYGYNPSQILDVNSDGLLDWVETDGGVLSGPGGFAEHSGVWLNTGSGWIRNTDWAMPYNYDHYDSKYHPAPLGTSFVWDPIYHQDFYGDRNGTLADVNGDGMPDWVMTSDIDQVDPVTLNGEYSRIWFNTGHGWEKDTSWPMFICSANIACLLGGDKDGNAYSILTDLNGDGLPDWIRTSNPNGTPSTSKFFLNSRNGWIQKPYFTFPSHMIWGTYTSNPMLGDFDGPSLSGSFNQFSRHRHDALFDVNNDGLQDWVESTFIEDPLTPPPPVDIWHDVWKFSGKQADLLSSVTLPTGGFLTFEYKSQGISGRNPTEQTQTITVLSSLKEEETSGAHTTNYSYSNGKYFYPENAPRRFAGFEKVTEILPDNSKKVSYFHEGDGNSAFYYETEDHFSKIGKIYRQAVYNANGNLYQIIINKWDRFNQGIDKDFVKLVRTTKETYDGNSTHKDTAEEFLYYDANGNLMQKINYGEVNASGDGTFTDTGADKSVENITYATDGGNIVGLPSSDTVSDQSGNKVREQKVYYDDLPFGQVLKGNTTKTENWKEVITYVNTQKSYNTYGLPTSETDPRGNTTTYTYDSYNLYPETVSDALGHATHYVYDYATGKPTKVTDQNNFVYQTSYDGLGRTLEEKVPDPVTGTPVLKTSYVYDDTPYNFLIHKTDYLDGDIYVETYQYFDGLNRPIQERQSAEEAGQFVVKDKTYDERGLLQKESLPYFSNGSNRTPATEDQNLYTNYIYDPMDRVLTATNAVGTMTSIYDDFKTTAIDANGHIRNYYKDAYGNLVKVEEKNGADTYTTLYNWSLNGNLTKITDALSNVRNFTYDALGRRLTAEDLHAPADATYGIRTYNYNDAGNITQTTNPNSDIVNYTYDTLNRPISEDSAGTAGMDILYSYDACQNGMGKLCAVTMLSGASSAYQYNPAGGIFREQKIINNNTFNTSYQYDRQGNILSMTYPDNSGTYNTYNSAGLLNYIDAEESTGEWYTIIQDIDYAPNGQIAVEKYGNLVTTINTYDPTQLYRLTNKKSTNRYNLKIQDISYTYDSVGNITQITDASNTNAGKTVDYIYDDLYRLISAMAHSTANGQDYRQTFSYDATGNILSKSDIGTYQYTGNTGTNFANPHAVTSIGATAITYDKNGNMLTDGTVANTWDYKDELVKSSIAGKNINYYYDEAGNRAWVKTINPAANQLKVAGGNPKNTDLSSEDRAIGSKIISRTTNTYYPNKFYNVTGTKKTNHVFIGNQLVATIETNGEHAPPYYVTTDNVLGSNVITDYYGNLKETSDYYPFGAIRLDEKSSAFSEQRKFGGHEHDIATDFDYFGARYYNGKWGRFISQDPMFWSLPKESLMNPQNWNSYSYALNNPITNIDPDGKMTVDSINTFINNIFSRLSWNSNQDQQKQTQQNSQQQRTVLNSPVGNAPISSLFMADRSNCSICSKTHGGTDYAVPIGTPVHATASGVVVESGVLNGYGNNVIINHGQSVIEPNNNIYTLYAHGSSLEVKQGQTVKTNDIIMYSGSTGNSTGPHLHYEVVSNPTYPVNFFHNLNIRYGPTELSKLLNK